MADANDTTTNPSATDAAAAKVGPLADKAKQFAKDRPFASAALIGVIGVALLNTLRGTGRKA